MKKVKIISIFVLFVILVLAFSGNILAEDKVLTMWSRHSSVEVLRPAVKKYNDMDNGIKIELTSIPQENFSSKFMAALSSDSAPDLISMDLILVPHFSSLGAFKDITDKYESLEYKDQLVDSMIRLGERDGKQYALPFSADVSALIYNKDHFREVGLDPEDPPETWSELREYSKKLTTEEHYGYIYAGASSGSQMFTFAPLIWGNGGRILNDEGTESTVNSQEALEALQFYVDLTINEEVTPPGVISYSFPQLVDSFTAGKASMLLNGNFLINTLNTNYPDLDYGVALIPRQEGKGHSSFSGGELIAITHNTKYEKEAWQFMEYALSRNIQIEVWANNGVLPVRKDFFDNKYFNIEPKYKVFTEALKVAHVPRTTKYFEVYKALMAPVQNALSGKISPEEALAEADKKIDKIVNK